MDITAFPTWNANGHGYYMRGRWEKQPVLDNLPSTWHLCLFVLVGDDCRRSLFVRYSCGTSQSEAPATRSRHGEEYTWFTVSWQDTSVRSRKRCWDTSICIHTYTQVYIFTDRHISVTNLSNPQCLEVYPESPS